MLFVSRGRKAKIRIGFNFVVNVLKIDKRHVRLGVSLQTMRIWRGEIAPISKGNELCAKQKPK
jgi:sRNA-binding carbon storage regulator CsrA